MTFPARNHSFKSPSYTQVFQDLENPWGGELITYLILFIVVLVDFKASWVLFSTIVSYFAAPVDPGPSEENWLHASLKS